MLFHIFGPYRHPVGVALGAVLFVGLVSGAARTEPASEIGKLIDMARRMNPDIAAAALEADAARARVDSVGAFDDPKFKVELASPRAGRSLAPSGRISEELYEVRQMLPLWGKLELKREIAEWDAMKARATARDVENQVAYRVKVAYAEYHVAHLAADETRRLATTVRRLADIARQRYTQSAGKQADATGAAAESSALRAEIARLDSDRERARLRLNRLLGRDTRTPLPATPHPRRIPRLDAAVIERLVDRAHAESPTIGAGVAAANSAERARRLAERNFYPDVELGLGAMRENGRFDNYRAMVEVTIPLQWGRREAEQREATAMAASARAKVEAMRQDVAADIREARAMLDALAARRRAVTGTTVPNARIALDSAVNAYQLGREEFPAVLAAEQSLRRALVETITVQFEEQVRLAEIERLIGGEL